MLNKLLTLALGILIAHQIEAAYWHEWDMFHMPGGVQLNVLLNLVIFLVLLPVYLSACSRGPRGYLCAWVITVGSAVVLPVHAGFALAGRSEFHLPVSMLLIAAAFVTAVVLAMVLRRSRHEFP